MMKVTHSWVRSGIPIESIEHVRCSARYWGLIFEKQVLIQEYSKIFAIQILHNDLIKCDLVSNKYNKQT